MHRLLLIGGLMVAFGFGILADGMLPPAQADPAPTRATYTNALSTNDRPDIDQPFYLTDHDLYQRWFVMLVPRGVNEAPLILLIDSQTGANFLLRPDPGEPSGLSWLLIDRKR